MSRIASICSCLMLVLLISSESRAQQESKSLWSSMLGRGSAPSANPKAATADDSAKTSWLNPFASKSDSAAKAPKRTASTMGKIGQTSKRWWDNTVDFVNPFNDKPKPRTNQGYKPQEQTEISDSGGLFGWTRRDKKETEKPKSVNEFLQGTNPLLDPTIR